jgi:hypothetical protein
MTVHSLRDHGRRASRHWFAIFVSATDDCGHEAKSWSCRPSLIEQLRGRRKLAFKQAASSFNFLLQTLLLMAMPDLFIVLVPTNITLTFEMRSQSNFTVHLM